MKEMEINFREITVETAEQMGYLPSALEYAYKSVAGCSILSPATDRAFEDAYVSEQARIYRKFGVDKNYLVKIPESWLKSKEFIN